MAWSNKSKKEIVNKVNDGNKRLPLYRGVIQGEDRNQVGQIAFWDNKSDNPKAPIMSGNITLVSGEKFRVVLWEGKKV